MGGVSTGGGTMEFVRENQQKILKETSDALKGQTSPVTTDSIVIKGEASPVNTDSIVKGETSPVTTDSIVTSIVPPVADSVIKTYAPISPVDSSTVPPPL
jgi:hypothetical protein